MPLRDAATVMVVDDRPDLEVLMVQRTSSAVFGPSAWVFPGGRVDPDDAADHEHITLGLTDEEASVLLDLSSGGRAWWIAAVRETLEEAGLLIGSTAAEPALVNDIRSAVHADPTAFVDRMATNGLRIDLRELHEVARFITPIGPPRRFDARFFLARAPAGQTAEPDANEVVHHCWIRPTDALEHFQAGEFPLMSVTHRMLACLARYARTDDLLKRAADRRPVERIRVADPEGEYRVLLPGDAGYETAEVEIEQGWVRI